MRRVVVLLIAATMFGTGPAARADERVLFHQDFRSAPGCQPIEGSCVYSVQGRQLQEYYEIAVRNGGGLVAPPMKLFTGSFALPPVTLSGPGSYSRGSVSTIDVRYSYDDAMVRCVGYVGDTCVANFPFDPTQPVRPGTPQCGSVSDIREYLECLGPWIGRLQAPVGGQLVIGMSRIEGDQTTFDEQVRIPLVGQVLAVVAP